MALVEVVQKSFPYSKLGQDCLSDAGCLSQMVWGCGYSLVGEKHQPRPTAHVGVFHPQTNLAASTFALSHVGSTSFSMKASNVLIIVSSILVRKSPLEGSEGLFFGIKAPIKSDGVWGPFNNRFDLKVDPIWRPLDRVLLRSVGSDQGSNPPLIMPYTDLVTAVRDGVVWRFNIGSQGVI